MAFSLKESAYAEEQMLLAAVPGAARERSPREDGGAAEGAEFPASGVHALAPSIYTPATVAESLIVLLQRVGVTEAFGITGGGIAPFCDKLGRSAIKLFHFRHEAGAAFAAAEASLASGRPTVVFTTAGPGLTNTLTGMIAARWEGAKVILVSACTSPAQRGRWVFQETTVHTMSAGVMTAGPWFNYVAIVDHPSELDEVGIRLAMGVQRPEGFVAHVSLPRSMQMSAVSQASSGNIETLVVNEGAAKNAAIFAPRLKAAPFVIWTGYGARYASEAIRLLAERSGALVISSPRGKGIMPESHPQFLGVTGLGGHVEVEAFLAAHPPEYILVLGTRMGECTSFWKREFVPIQGFIHVDLDREVFGAAYPEAKTFPVEVEIGAFVEALLEHFPEVEDASTASTSGPASNTRVRDTRHPLRLSYPPLMPRPNTPIRTQFLMQAIQRVIVEGTNAIVMTEAGNAFAWGSQALRFDRPHRYRVSMGWGSMGQAAAGVLGAAVGSGEKAVAILGDGAMLMHNELSTAVQYGIPAIWIILNDSSYGMIDQGMRLEGLSPVGTQIPRTDFVAIARAMGGDGIRLESEADIEGALKLSMRVPGPFVLDVIVDPDELGPIARRVQALAKQTHGQTIPSTQKGLF